MDFELRGRVTIGIVYIENQAFVIDSGIDENEIRKTINYLESNGKKIEGLLLTHYHADHSGGAYFARKRGINIYGDDETQFILRHPETAHLLFTGFFNEVFIQSKFITPNPVEIYNINQLNFKNIPKIIDLKGHTMNQIGYQFGDLLFVGDALFSETNLEKHPIPYFVDFSNFKNTLMKIRDMSISKVVCSHGGLLDNPSKTIEFNLERLREITELIDDVVRRKNDSMNYVISEILRHYNIPRSSIEYFLDTAALKSIIMSIFKIEYYEGELYLKERK